MTKRQERQQETRAALLDAAERCFAARGYDAVTVPEIAKDAGYTTGAVYSNFSGKEDLFLALMDRVIGGEAARRAAAVLATTTPRDRLGEISRLWAGMVRDRPDLLVLFVEFWSYSRRDPELREEVARRLAGTRAGMAALIAADPQAGPDTAPPEEVAAAVYAMAHGLALHHLADPEGMPIEQLEQAVTWIFRGAGYTME